MLDERTGRVFGLLEPLISEASSAIEVEGFRWIEVSDQNAPLDEAANLLHEGGFQSRIEQVKDDAGKGVDLLDRVIDPGKDIIDDICVSVLSHACMHVADRARIMIQRTSAGGEVGQLIAPIEETIVPVSGTDRVL